MEAETWRDELRRAWKRYVLDAEIEQEVVRQGARESVIALAEEHKGRSFDTYLKILVASRGNA